MHIRKAKEDDVRTFVKWAGEAEELQTYAGDHLGESFYRKIVMDGLCLVFEMEEKIAGFLIAELDSGLDFSYLTQIFVLPDYRGMGIGSKLVDAYIDRCKKENVKRSYLFAQSDNDKAVIFYEKHGFKKGKPYIAMHKDFR